MKRYKYAEMMDERIVAPTVVINYGAVVVATIVSIVLGFVWYGPLFGKPWIKLMGFDKKKMDAAAKKGMWKTYVVMMVSTFVMAFVLAHFVGYVQAKS